MRRLSQIIAMALCAAGLAAEATQASGGEVISMGIENVGFLEPTADCPVAVVEFDLVSPEGDSLGNGTSCAKAIEGCEPFFVGCRQKLQVALTLALAGGNVQVAATLNERFTSFTSVKQRVKGFVAGGTGAYAGAQGKLVGGGTLAFEEDGSVTTDVLWVLRVN